MVAQTTLLEISCRGSNSSVQIEGGHKSQMFWKGPSCFSISSGPGAALSLADTIYVKRYVDQKGKNQPTSQSIKADKKRSRLYLAIMTKQGGL